MLLSLDRRFLFVKGIKVAGTSVELLIGPQLEEGAVVTPMGAPGEFPTLRPRNFESRHGLGRFHDHMPATAIRSIIGVWLYERLFKFGIVRNPFEKIRSLHIMRLAEDRPRPLDVTIEECESEAVRVCDGGSMIVHRVLMYEKLDAELAELLPSLGLHFPGSLSIRARSEHRRDYRGAPIVFSPRQAERVRDKFAFEFKFYEQRGYKAEP